MKRTHLWRLLPGAALILSVASPSLALTLGNVQGVATIGRPLDLTVPVTLDSERDAGVLCPRVDVSYGDNRVELRQLEPPVARGSTAVLRLRVPQAVNEAFVTVQVQVGCVQTLSRRFVLLTEHPGDTLTAAAQPSPVAPAVLPASTALPVLSPSSEATMPARAPVVVPAASVAAEVPAPRQTRRVAPAPRPPATQPRRVERPRLKLDAPESLPRATGKAQPAGPAAQAPAAPPAPATLPAAPAAPTPEEAARNAERMASLEADVRAMREMMVRNEALVAELRSRLQEAQGDRYSNELVYGLGGLLALASALAAVFWRRSRRAGNPSASWWSDQVPEGEAELHEDMAAPPRKRASVPVDSLLERPAAAQPVSIMASSLSGFGEVVPGDADIDAAPARAEVFAPVSDRAPLTAGFGDGDLPAAVPAAPALSIDEIAEVQQQAEFFLSLGEQERAVAVLREQIDSHPHASTVPWLELMDIYWRLQRPQEYEQLRRDFEWLFGTTAPSYLAYEEEQAGLSAQPELLARIQSAWASPTVLGELEQAVMRRPGPGGAYLGVQGLRELLMLHGVAADLQSDESAPEESPAFASAAVSTSGAAAGQPVMSLDPLPDQGWNRLAPADARPLGLDVNLDDLDLPPAKGIRAARGGDHLLDFELDLSEKFKLPKR
ncbi:hypothetical protein JI739_01215 [Ramlibacter sp. AW1]|uniref:Tfp pilus assembly protein FimV n=1 Tax=Ramlibacter aurantiacus TaxID=2801330 RepID=A0A936ZKH4_9BURK|nr:hypothetical protein [Ramlibacter aurantiacus]MBL0418953.1 hypothetical protein [Ramlibacter aurantiacus]